MEVPLQAVAGGRVGDHYGEESDTDRNHPEVEHDDVVLW
jgi:hypothetical protein